MNRFLPARLMFSAAAVAGFVAVGGPALADAIPPVPMAPHHATYKLTLLKAKGANAPASAAGVIDYNFTGSACDGYTTIFRQMTEMQPAEGDSKLNDMRSTTFEDAAATRFTFQTKTSTDDEAVSDLDGRAQRSPDGSIAVDVKQPAGKATFGAEVLFPTEHLRRVIAAAEKGDKLLSALVYDGSESGKRLYHTLTVIGAPIGGAADDPAGLNEATKSLRRWPVVISYFEGDNEDQPDYVLSSDLYENGISRALKLDYGDFVLAGALTDLTVTPQAECKR